MSVLRAHKAFKALQDQRAHREFRAMLGRQDRRAYREFKVFKAWQGQLVLRVQMGILALQVLQARHLL
jgi:hypothetical protein